MSSENFAKLYKNEGKPDDLRRRRTETSVELRKQKGNEEMMKRRNLTVDLEDESVTSGGSDVEDSRPAPQLMSMEEAVAVLQNNPTSEQIRRAFESVRRTLSRSKDPPIAKIIQLGFPFALVQALSLQDEKVQFEAAWALTNIVSGTSEQTMAVVNAGAIPPLVKLCASPCAKMAEQAIWAIANIAGDSAQLRDKLIEAGTLDVLIELSKRTKDLNAPFARILTWTFSNFTRHKKPQVSYDVLDRIAPALAILLKYKDTPTQTDACWAFSYLTDGTDENIELAYKHGIVCDVVEFINSGQDSLISPSLRVLGNFATGNDHLTQVVIDTGILTGAVPQLMLSTNNTFVKECCWLISNVLAGTQQQIQDVIDAQLLPLIMNILQNGQHRLQYEAGWAVANLCYGGTANQILEICRIKNGVEAICSCLALKNNELTLNMLEALSHVLRTVGQTDPANLDKVRERVEECGGLDHLETLQQHESEKVYSLAYKIVEEFFSDEDDEGVAIADKPISNVSETNTFNF